MATEIKLRERMKDFPCAFNLQCSPPSRQLLLNIQHNLATDKPTGKYLKSEEIRNNNLLTWVEHLLGGKTKEINDEVIKSTKKSNIPSIGNCVFILLEEANFIDAEEYIDALEAMQERQDFEKLMTEAKAEQAYYYSRMGEFDMSVKLFQEVVAKEPLNLLWKFGLGLMYRRTTNFNVCYSINKEYDRSQLIRLATSNLLDVTKDDDQRLCGLAYAQLIGMLNTCSRDEQDHCFHGRQGHDLCHSALRVSPDDPTVLCNCGKYFMNTSTDKAIEMLERSVSIRENAKTFHYLGMCYEKKAEKTALRLVSPNIKTQKHYNATKDPRRASFGIDYTNKTYNKERQKPLHVSRRHSTECDYPNITHASELAANECQAKFPRKPELDKDHFRPKKIKLDPKCCLVEKAVKSYERAIQLSNERNIPAILSLAKLYFRSDCVKEALQQYRKIIKLQENRLGYLVTLITAYEEAGLCLFKLKNINQRKEQEFYEQGKDYFTKAISLAADLASMKSCPTNCTTFAGKSFQVLTEDIDRMDKRKEDSREYIRLLQLIRDHRGVVSAIKAMLDSGTELDDPEIVLSGINSYLKQGEYENALAFVNMVKTSSQSCLKATDTFPTGCTEMKALQDVIAKLLVFVSWERLRLQSCDAKRIFRNLFATKYEEFAEIHSDLEDEDNQAKILIVNDTLQDCEEGLGQSTKVSIQLQEMFLQQLGFNSFRNLEESLHYHDEIDALLDEMKKYPLVLLVLTEETRDPVFDHILKILPQIRDEKDNPINLFIIQTSDRVIVPDSLIWYKQQGFTLLENDHIFYDNQNSDSLDVTNSSIKVQMSTASSNVVNTSDEEQRPSQNLDVVDTSGMQQSSSARFDVVYTSNVEQNASKILDVADTSDLEQRLSASLHMVDTSEVERRPSASLDVVDTSEMCQRPSTTSFMTDTTGGDQTPTKNLELATIRNVNEISNSNLDGKNTSDTQQNLTACVVSGPNYTYRAHTVSVGATEAKEVLQEHAKQSHDTFVERIMSLVCFLLHMDYSQLSEEYRKLKP